MLFQQTDIKNYIPITFDDYAKGLDKLFDTAISNNLCLEVNSIPRKGNSTYLYTLPYKYSDKKFLFIYKNNAAANYHYQKSGKPNNVRYSTLTNSICGYGFDVCVMELYIPLTTKEKQFIQENILTRVLNPKQYSVIILNSAASDEIYYKYGEKI